MTPEATKLKIVVDSLINDYFVSAFVIKFLWGCESRSPWAFFICRSKFNQEIARQQKEIDNAIKGL